MESRAAVPPRAHRETRRESHSSEPAAAMDAAAMSRREALEVTRGDEARPIQPRRFSIVLRKPLAARNDGSAPKSAFKSSEKTRASEANEKTRTKGVTFMAPDAPDTPAARAVAVTHRRARMRTRKGTGRSVAARTFSLVLREPKVEAHEAAERDRHGTMECSVELVTDTHARRQSKSNSQKVRPSASATAGRDVFGDGDSRRNDARKKQREKERQPFEPRDVERVLPTTQ